MAKAKTILIFGGTGSLGKVLVKKFLTNNKVYVYSRDESKHVNIRALFPSVCSIMGDVRDYNSVFRALLVSKPDIVINAAALKNVPECEEFPLEAVQTNIFGAANIVRAVECFGKVSKLLYISTDKCAKPVNSYGMSKALAERIHLTANNCISNAVRYGNVLSSRGSVIPFFKNKLEKGENLPITHEGMTRFLLSLDQAVDLIFDALEDCGGKKIFVPKVKSSLVVTLADCLKKHYNSDVKLEYVGVRPGEKIDEILVSEEEILRTEDAGKVFIIHDINGSKKFNDIDKEYSSSDHTMGMDELKPFLKKHGVI